MTNERIRIKIAERCGWTAEKWSSGGWQVYKPCPTGKDRERVTDGGYGSREAAMLNAAPDYPSDLNAMHEAEKTLNEKQQVWYLTKLLQVRYRTGADHGMIACMQDKLAFATARQRSEAFLRTFGEWEEDEGGVERGEK